MNNEIDNLIFTFRLLCDYFEDFPARDAKYFQPHRLINRPLHLQTS